MVKEELIIGIGKWIVDYLELPNYLYVKSKSHFEGEKVYDSEEKYWRDILGPSFYKHSLMKPKILEGDCVVLKNFQLSQWFPRVSGLYWTYYGAQLRRLSERKLKHSPGLGFHYKPHEKKQMIHGGLGTLRTEEIEGSRLFGATTSGNLNASVPVLISKRVSKSLLKFSKRNPSIEVNLRGVIKRVPFTYQYHFSSMPKLILYVNSILNVKKYTSDFKLSASAWTIYYNKSAKGDKRYGFTYCSFNPIEEASIVDATDWIQNYIYEYTKGKGLPICDFDEISPRFNSAVVPLKDVMTGNVNYDALNSLFQGIDFRKQDPLVRLYD